MQLTPHTRLSMDKLLGKRIDAAKAAMERSETEWAKTYWATVMAQLVRKLNVYGVSDVESETRQIQTSDTE